MRFSFFKSVRARGVLCTPELLREAVESEALSALARRIAMTKDDKKRGELKRALPIVTWQGFAKNGRRRNDEMEPSGLFMLDIDHMDEEPRRFFVHSVKKRVKELGIMVVHKTPSCEGLRIVALCRHESIEDNQRWLAGELRIKAYDEVCKDMARSSFLVPKKYFFYLNEEMFEAPSSSAPSVSPNEGERVKREEQSASEAGDEEVVQTKESFPAYYETSHSPSSGELEGARARARISYSSIVEALAEQLGGVPSHGSRNNFLFSMACHLRYVCDNNPDWIEAILPNYGEAQEKLRRSIVSACNRAQTPYMPRVVQRALRVAQNNECERVAEESGKGDFEMFGEEPPQLPDRLPPLIELLTSRVPDLYKPAVAMAVFPSLGCHLHGVKFRYIDNVEHEPAFMVLQIAGQSMGKGAVNRPIDFIMESIREHDKEGRLREKEWKEQCKVRSANKEKPKRPDDICIQWLMSNVTQAAFVMRLADAGRCGGRPLYIRLDEVEGLSGLCGRGYNANTELIRILYDRGKWGQERVGVDSVTESPDARLNFNASATPATASMFFTRKAMVDGTISRLSLCTIVRPGGKREFPRFGIYDETFGEELRPFLERLDSASGVIECDEVDSLAEQLRNENEDITVLSGDESFEVLSFRSNRSAFDRAMLLYIAHEGWSKELSDFIRWSEQYDLWCKMNFFGADIYDAMNGAETKRKRGPKNMLERLPGRFSLKELKQMNICSNVNQNIKNWLHRGFIEKDEATGEYFKIKS